MGDENWLDQPSISCKPFGQIVSLAPQSELCNTMYKPNYPPIMMPITRRTFSRSTCLKNVGKLPEAMATYGTPEYSLRLHSRAFDHPAQYGQSNAALVEFLSNRNSLDARPQYCRSWEVYKIFDHARGALCQPMRKDRCSPWRTKLARESYLK